MGDKTSDVAMLNLIHSNSITHNKAINENMPQASRSPKNYPTSNVSPMLLQKQSMKGGTLTSQQKLVLETFADFAALKTSNNHSQMQ